MSRFISVDWGTSRLRVALVESEGWQLMAQTASDQGIKATFAEWQASGEDRATFFQQRLLQQLHQLQGETTWSLSSLPVVLSGMASSSIGWRELPYGELPFSLEKGQLPYWRLSARDDFPHELLLLSGLQQPGDVMRGEEVQAMGWFEWANRPAGDHSLILPGTHSKHLQIVDGQLTAFQTFMTGELYELLSKHSILKGPGGTIDSDEEQTAFLAGVKASELGLSPALFSTRAMVLQGIIAPNASSAYLSGLLIGAEGRSIPHGNARLWLLASESVSFWYQLALQSLFPDRTIETVPTSFSIPLAVIGQYHALTSL